MQHIMGIRKVVLGVLVAVLALGVIFAAAPAKASTGTFDVTVVHGINGRSLGLSKDLPVNVTIYKDGAEFAYINGFTFKERFSAALPAGEYKIEVFSTELGTIVPSMTLGPVEIGAGADLLIRAKLMDGTPVLTVKGR